MQQEIQWESYNEPLSMFKEKQLPEIKAKIITVDMFNPFVADEIIQFGWDATYRVLRSVLIEMVFGVEDGRCK